MAQNNAIIVMLLYVILFKLHRVAMAIILVISYTISCAVVSLMLICYVLMVCYDVLLWCYVIMIHYNFMLWCYFNV